MPVSQGRSAVNLLLCPQQVLLDKFRVGDGLTVLVQLVSAIVEAFQYKQLVLAAVLVPAWDTAEAERCSMQSSTSPEKERRGEPWYEIVSGLNAAGASHPMPDIIQSGNQDHVGLTSSWALTYRLRLHLDGA